MKKQAFTLAEVLITLTIIGVVAAMTIPTLVTNYNKRVVEVRLQKTHAELYQAFKLAEVDHGNLATWSYTAGNSNDNIGNFIKKYLLPYIKHSKYCEKSNLQDCFVTPLESASGLMGFPTSEAYTHQRALTLNNGVTVFFQSGFGSDNSKHLHVVVDVNGPKQGSNLLGKDIFSMFFSLNNNEQLRQGFWMYGFNNQIIPTREEMLQLCKSENPRMCSALIQNDGWKIKDDYPWW